MKFDMERKPLLIFVLGLVMMIFIIPNGQALADIAPPHPPMGSDISPGDEITQVRMVSEYVVLSIHSDPDYYWGRADIDATFNMFNTGDEDEYMRVRYPMHHNLEELEYFESTDDCGIYPGTPVKDLSIWVNDEPVEVDIQYETVINQEASSREEQDIWMDIPCWGHFNVYFPSQKFVEIKVSYHVSGYERGSGGTTFDYLIGTGAGWKDTIESATIVARFPYPLSGLNINHCVPENCEISGWEVIWRFEDFEPEGLISVNTVNPDIWDQVIIEQKRLEIDDQDGEAWGRLAKAYKDSLKERKGYLVINDEYDEEVFDLSVQAYQVAIKLLPNDPDWHYGLAELVCSYIDQFRYSNEIKAKELLSSCGEEIDLILALDPDYSPTDAWLKPISILQDIYLQTQSYYENPGPSDDQLIQTSQAEWAATITHLPPEQTITPPSIIPTSTITPAPDTSIEVVGFLQSQFIRNSFFVVGAIIIGVGFLILAIIFVMIRRRNK
jgi:hypothetical protein